MVREHEKESVGLLAPAAQRQAFEGSLERLVEEYVADLVALGRSADQVRHVDKRLRRLMRECTWRSLREATPDSFLRWRSTQGQAAKTLNEYLAAVSAFCTWLRKQGRISANPFADISKVDTRGKQRLQRRALSDEQTRALLKSPEPRRTIYLVALHTGLRRGEINALRKDDLRLDQAGSSVRLRAVTSKNRREQYLPMHREVAVALEAFVGAAAGANDLVFPHGIPPMKVMREDFKTAGIPLLDERGLPCAAHDLHHAFTAGGRLAARGDGTGPPQ